jgi:hypothetical protein
MTLSRETFRSLIRQLEQEHGPEQGLYPVCRFTFRVQFDDGAEYQIRWPRGAANPVWEVARRP